MASTGTVIEDVLMAWIESQPEMLTIPARVYPFKKVPQNSTWPYVTVFRVFGGRMRSLNGPTTRVSHPRIQVDFWGRDYTQNRRLGQAILERIDGFRGDMGGRTVQDITVHDDRDNNDAPDINPVHGDEQTVFRYTLDMTIWFEEG